MQKIDRREFIKLSFETAAALAVGSLFNPADPAGAKPIKCEGPLPPESKSVYEDDYHIVLNMSQPGLTLGEAMQLATRMHALHRQFPDGYSYYTSNLEKLHETIQKRIEVYAPLFIEEGVISPEGIDARRVLNTNNIKVLASPNGIGFSDCTRILAIGTNMADLFQNGIDHKVVHELAHIAEGPDGCIKQASVKEPTADIIAIRLMSALALKGDREATCALINELMFVSFAAAEIAALEGGELSHAEILDWKESFMTSEPEKEYMALDRQLWAKDPKAKRDAKTTYGFQPLDIIMRAHKINGEKHDIIEEGLALPGKSEKETHLPQSMAKFTQFMRDADVLVAKANLGGYWTVVSKSL